eukprot:1162040-Pelagomonas_calceolata.AAC.1
MQNKVVAPLCHYQAQEPCDGDEPNRSCAASGMIKEKPTPAIRPRALRKGSLTSKLARVPPKGPQVARSCLCDVSPTKGKERKDTLARHESQTELPV